MVLDGNGHRIDACGKVRIFACTAKNVTIKNITLENGFSDASCGAIVNSRASDGFSGDMASGAIYNSGELNISEVIFYQNRATWGAAIYNRGKLSISASEFDYNHAQMGGAIYNDGGRFSICESKFWVNTSKFNGGAIYNLHGKELKIFKSKLDGNSTKQFGGAIYNQYGKLNIIESRIIDNSATNNGGAIYNLEGEISITASTFDKNSSSGFRSRGSGGAIYSEGDGKLDIVESQFNKNSADGSGGAVYANKTKVTISQSSFHRNLSEDYYDGLTENQRDCALLVFGSDNLELNDCTFDNRDMEKEAIDKLIELFC